MDKSDDFRILPILNSQFAVIDETIYVSAFNYNGVYAVDIISGKLRFIGKFLNYGNFDMALFEGKGCNEKLIFVPGRASEIAFYDRKKNQIEEVSMKSVLISDSIAMCTCIIINDILYLFPVKTTLVILYDMNEKRILNAVDIINVYKSVFGRIDALLSNTDSNYIYDNKIYIACWMQPAFMSLDLDSKKIDFYQVIEGEKGFCSLCGQGNIIYALDRNGMLLKWDINSKKIMEKSRIFENQNNVVLYNKIAVIGQHIYLFSNSGILKIAKMTLNMKLEREGLPQKVLNLLRKEYSDETIYIGCLKGEELYCYTDKKRYLCVDIKNENLKWVRNIIYDVDELRKNIFDETSMGIKNKVIYETEAVTLNELIDRLASFNYGLDISKTDIGRAIYKEQKI